MTDINRLTTAEVSGSDLVPVFSVSNSDSRKISITALTNYITAQTVTDGEVSQYFMPTASGQTVTVGNPGKNTRLIVQPTASISALTVVLDTRPVDRETLVFTTTQSILALTITGQTLGAPVTLPANSAFMLQYDALTKKWLTISAAVQSGTDPLPDGNYGDITVSNGGTVMTINPGVVDNGKLAQMPQATFKMRAGDSGAGQPIDGTPAQAKAALAIDVTDVSGLGTLATQNGTFSGTFSGNSSGTNTGDQNTFATVSVSGQPDVTANIPATALTLAAGANVTLTTNNTTKTVTVAAASGGSISVSDEGTVISSAATSFNFTGAGVTASAVGGAVTVNVPGGGGGSGIQTFVFDPPIKDGSVDYTAELEAVIRQANGLSTDGTGTISANVAYVYCAPGRYLIRNMNPSTTAAASTATNSGTFTNGSNSITLTDASAFSAGSNLVAKVYTPQGVYEGRFSRTAGSNTITFTPGQTGRSLAGLTWVVGTRVEQVGVGLSMLLKAEPNTVTFVYYCNESAILNQAAMANMNAGTIRKTVRNVTLGAALDWFPSGDDTVCSVINVDSTVGFNPGDICVLTAANPLPYNNNDRVGEAFRIQNVDSSGNIYAHGVLEWHYVYEAFGATSIGLNLVPKTAVKIDLEGLNFEGAPSLLGIDTINPYQTALYSDGSPNNVFGPQRAVSISVTGTTATVTTPVAHGLTPFISSPRVDGQQILIEGTGVSGLNIYALPTSTPTTTTFTYTVSGVTAGTYTGTYRVVADCQSGITEGRALSLSYAPYLRVRNCEANYPWAAFIRNAYCPFTRIENCGYTNASNALSSTNAKARLGYGVYCYGWSTGTVVDGGTWIGGRHLLTTAAPSRSTWSAAEWVYQGQPTDITVMNTVSIDAYGIPYDTHEEASLTTFKNVIAINPARGHDGGSYAGAGAHLRGRRSRIFGYYQKGGTLGIRYVGDAEGRVFAEAKPRPTTALRPTTLTWPLSAATLPLWGSDGFASSGTVYVEQQAGTGVYIACTYTNRTTSGGFAVLTGVSSAGAGTGNLESGAFVRQANVASITVAGTTATVTTTANHGFITGQADVILRIRGADQAGYNLTAVATITGANTFTYTLVTTDDNSQTVTIPTVSATGNFITWQDWSQYPTHLLKDVVIEGIRSRDDSTQAIWLENCSNALKTEVRGSGIMIRSVPRGITVGNQTRLHLDDVTMSLVKIRGIETGTGAYINVRRVVMDSAQNQGATVVPFYFAGTGVQMHIGEMDLVFGRTATNAGSPNPAAIFDGTSSGNYTYSLGRLKLRDYYNANLTAAICPTIIPVSTTSTFNLAGGGEELNLMLTTPTFTTSSATLGQRGLNGRFLVMRPLAVSDTNAVGNLTLDVLRNGTSIFGANKITIPSGNTLSTAGTAPTLQTTTSMIDGLASLTVTGLSTSGAETAKVNNVTLLGYWV